MPKFTREDALRYHSMGKPGKIEVVPTKPYSSQLDLSLAYSPGVAEPCLEIEKDPHAAYDYTAKGNLVAVISNGTAVLGLGDIGAMAGKPVMEGKGLLFKIFAGVDVFDIEINEKNPEKFIEIVKAISPTFGGINLEDIKAPECFEIEERLKAELDIPLMHDDQHGTAIISAAGLINALEIVGKKIENIKIVVNGAGAAANSCTMLYMMLGAKLENIVMLDSKGVISKKRTDLNDRKKPFATSREITTLAEAVKNADVFVGLSVADVLTAEMVQSMAAKPIVFALANPNPEISYENAMSARKDLIFATGRSDFPNQINNVLGFPYIFRGALDCRATKINEAMKLAAVKALAALTKEPVPDIVNMAYGTTKIKFGKEYIIPKPMDPRLLTIVAPAVVKAAMESGVAQKKIEDWEEYDLFLQKIMGSDNSLMRNIYAIARKCPKRVVFCETMHVNMLSAAEKALAEGICQPILLGNEEKIAAIAAENDINIEGIEIINLRHDREESRRIDFAKKLSEKLGRAGMTYNEAYDKMFERNYFGMMLVECGMADALITGVYTNYDEIMRAAKQVVGVRSGLRNVAAINILNTKNGLFFLADTHFNRFPTEETLLDIARITHSTVKNFMHEDPVMAMLAASNFGTEKDGVPATIQNVIKILHAENPEIQIDGEMQVNFALNKKLRDKNFPFNKIAGKDVNTLIFPTVTSANIAYKLLLEMGAGESYGPIQMGLNKPIHILDVESSVRSIVNMTAIAVYDAVKTIKN
ncbi:MAG: NADP-dependent malic enzyme [Prevotellaceae bacterium]|jgi:malate dehydrogenase (oxaloacetate-decarboxylating)(NADP+)|nr:NADP-dependent malic enzyme [Prevotellaceae bacterium]